MGSNKTENFKMIFVVGTFFLALLHLMRMIVIIAVTNYPFSSV